MNPSPSIGAAILTISDSAAAGIREDLSGSRLRDRVSALGWRVIVHEIIPDDAGRITGRTRELADDANVTLVITTGGTGVSIRDVTPEAVRPIIEREIPGLGELMRAEGLKKTSLAPLSRSFGGTRGHTLILCLPGSPKGAVESFDAVAHLVPHVIDLLQGRTEHSPEAGSNAKLKI